MGGCCDPRGCDRVFGRRFARGRAARYRRRGLDRTARRMVELLTETGLDGATVLEIGGGVGEIQLELLERGAASAMNLELSPAYDADAERLLAEKGLAGRVQRRLLDLATEPTAVGPADVVVLHRVVCCYPDYQRLLSAAAGRTRKHLVLSHPPRNVVSRTILATQNLMLRLSGSEFRTFAHPPAAMVEVLEANGLFLRTSDGGPVWRVVALSR